MTAREAILDALIRLERRTGRATFRVKEIVGEVLAATTEFQESTIRTHVTSVMCADAPAHHANHSNDLRRAGRGQYRRIANADFTSEPRHGSTHDSSPMEQSTGEPSETEEWFWEGHVQATIVAHLAATGWKILSVADTESRMQGTDIVASRDGLHLRVEVKGYPSEEYARGPRKGQKKPTSPATQARVWFAGALMSALILRDQHEDDAVAVGLPDFSTYRSLAEKVGRSLDQLEIAVIWVAEPGSVDCWKVPVR